MKTIGNILWFLFGGLIGGLSWVLAGCLWCITIVGIPVGLQCFKFASLAFFPFGKEVVYGGGGFSLLVNILWLLLSIPESSNQRIFTSSEYSLVAALRNGDGLGLCHSGMPVVRHHCRGPCGPPVLQNGPSGPDALWGVGCVAFCSHDPHFFMKNTCIVPLVVL